jgi:enoyl-[acyl-carrier-protein] reductase (NADH)
LAGLWLSFGQDYREATGKQVHQPELMGHAMAFLNSPAASGVNGTTLIVDSAHAMASLTNAFPPGKAIMDLITGPVKL